jgi:hypothetical protein
MAEPFMYSAAPVIRTALDETIRKYLSMTDVKAAVDGRYQFRGFIRPGPDHAALTLREAAAALMTRFLRLVQELEEAEREGVIQITEPPQLTLSPVGRSYRAQAVVTARIPHAGAASRKGS